MKRKLVNWIDGYLEFNKLNEAPSSFLTWSAISAVGASLKRKTVLKMGQQRIYPNMYILLVAPPGKARKGTAMNPAKRLLEAIGTNLAADSTTRAQLIRRLTQSTESITDSKTGGVMLHSSLTVFSPEFSVFMRQREVQMITDLTDLYDCPPRWVDETKKDDDAGCLNTIEGPFINILGATTPDNIRLSMPEDAIGGGLTSRMLFIYEARRRFKTPLDTFLLGYPFNRLDGYYDDMIPKLINDGAIKDILVVSDYMKRTRDSIYTLAYYLGTIHFISKRYLRTFTEHTHLLILINP